MEDCETIYVYSMSNKHTSPYKWGRAHHRGKISFLFWEISASLKSLYTNTQNLWNKEKTLYVCAQLQGYNLSETTETS